jgi:hypothetical protein
MPQKITLSEETLKRYINEIIMEELDEGGFRQLLQKIGQSKVGKAVGNYFRALGGNKKGIAAAQKSLGKAQKGLEKSNKMASDAAKRVGELGNEMDNLLKHKQFGRQYAGGPDGANYRGAVKQNYDKGRNQYRSARDSKFDALINQEKGLRKAGEFEKDIARHQKTMSDLQAGTRKARRTTGLVAGAGTVGTGLAFGTDYGQQQPMNEEVLKGYIKQIIKEELDESFMWIPSRNDLNNKRGYQWDNNLTAQQNRKNRRLNKAMIKQQNFKNHAEYMAANGHAVNQQPEEYGEEQDGGAQRPAQPSSYYPEDYPYKADRYKTAQFQTWYNQNFGGKLVVDGIWGPKTEAAYQQWRSSTMRQTGGGNDYVTV